jgi:glycosyltransferase involved in cell wall biosynthesis
MKKRICFFTVGFAFNRLIRMKYYEKIFPKDVEIFLFTTDKYKGKEKENYQFPWDLKRTKIHRENYSLFKLPFKLRKFCNDNKIDRLFNIGYFTGGICLLYATLFSKRDFIVNRFAKLGYKINSMKDFFIIFFRFLVFSLLLYPSKRIIFVDSAHKRFYRKLAEALFISENKIKYLPAPVNTELFKPESQAEARKKLNLPKEAKIVLFVGRTSHEKGAHILKKIISKNPDITFIVVGNITDQDYHKLNKENFIHEQKKSSEELVDYYNAADLFYNLQWTDSSGIGITTEESLASGTPALSCFKEGIIKNLALFLVPVNFKKANQKIKEFFKMSIEEREKLSIEARKYAEKYYSEKANREKYLDYYLN